MTIDQVNQQFTDLQTAFTKAAADASKFISDLKLQVAAGSPVTQAQLDALGANMSALTAQVGTFDVNNTEPPAVVPPLPPAAKK